MLNNAVVVVSLPVRFNKVDFNVFSDSEDAVTYRAELHENGRATVSELVRFIEDWITDDGGVGILTQSLVVRVDGDMYSYDIQYS